MHKKRSTNSTARLILPSLLILGLLLAVSVRTALATLPGGSTFEGGDGNLAVDTAGFHDWNSPVETITCPPAAPGSGTNCGLDLVNSQQDDSLGKGSKEDDPVPTVVNGSIPPSKDDLSRFYVNKERVGGNDFLYLAWERSNLLGSAHMDFELNQDATPSANGVTPVRTAGDLLIDFDFSGSGTPVLALHRWITTGNASTDCEASNTLPCWNKAVTLPPTMVEAAVNSAPVTDANPPNAPFTLDGNTKNGINSTFGEASINLTGTGIFPTDVCENFGAATLKSRSSGNSFTSELKDFIAPVPIRISNCGQIEIVKVTDPSPDPTNTSFDFLLDDGPLTNPGVPKNFSLVDGGSDITTVFAGSSYSAAETVPTGWELVSAVCNNGSGSLSGSTLSNISVSIDTLTTCTFTNKLQRGAILVTKTRKHAAGGPGDQPHPGVSFTVNGETKSTNASGQVCFDGLAFGDYNVVESVPSGYVGEGGSTTTVTKSVTVDNNAKCSDSPFVGETVSFNNTPLTNITVTVNSQVDGGTSSTITCVDSNSNTVASGNTGANGDGSATANNLLPGTYTCTVVIDP